jgi:hypothetical protein
MPTAKDIRVAPVSREAANACVERHHYSHSTVKNSQVHLGVFLDGRLEGAMQFGPSLDKRNLIGLVEGTPWNAFIELNRMAFSEALPRNSESRAIGVALKMLRKAYTHLQWVVSFADGTQCGDGTIYRASGFVLTGIRRNSTLWGAPNGDVISNISLRLASQRAVVARHSFTKGKHVLATGGGSSMKPYKDAGYRPLPGYQLRYLYFLDPTARERLTVPIVPFSRIGQLGAGMYRGKAREAGDGAVPAAHSGGATPTRALQSATDC